MNNEATPKAQNEIVIKDLVKEYGDVTAVDGLSLEIAKGEFFGFLGPNGAGKTTTISVLCGLLDPTSGSTHIAGFDIEKEAHKAKELIGVCPQEVAVYKFHVTDSVSVIFQTGSISDSVIWAEPSDLGDHQPGYCRRRNAALHADRVSIACLGVVGKA